MNRPSHNIFFTLACVLLCIAVTSCRSNKETVASGSEYTQENAADNDWTDLYIPVTFEMKSPKKVSFSGRMTMIRDRNICISLRFLGMEVGVLDLTPETVTAIDKYHRVAVQEPVTPLLLMTGLAYSDIQDLLLGRASDKARSKIDASPLSLTYGPMSATSAGDIPQYVILRATAGSVPVEIRLSYKPDKVRRNSGRTVSTTIPADYRIVDLRTLLQSIKSDYPL